ncbi:MAG: hypothetical protein FWF23_03160 [Alphaproteobacteria bacterium]|nr:hypothetical protein [Alphaproteobacteria bacterium]MCL2505564.1 hypothetical protein [Alphaproteobacteria bacterium]
MKCKIENGKLITQLLYVRIPFCVLNFTFYILLTAPAFANTTTPPLCKVGTAIEIVQSGTTWTWKCEGKYGGTTASCAPKIDGKCGTADGVATADAPTDARCSVGDAGAVTEEDNTFKWACNGINGGAAVTTCSAPKMITGVCGSAHGQGFATAPTTNLCSVGTNTELDGTGPWTWTCGGINGGNTSSTCTAEKTECGTPEEVALAGAPMCKGGIEPSNINIPVPAMSNGKGSALMTWNCGLGTCSATRCFWNVTSCIGTPDPVSTGANGCGGAINYYGSDIKIYAQVIAGGGGGLPSSPRAGGGSSIVGINRNGSSFEQSIASAATTDSQPTGIKQTGTINFRNGAKLEAYVGGGGGGGDTIVVGGGGGAGWNGGVGGSSGANIYPASGASGSRFKGGAGASYTGPAPGSVTRGGQPGNGNIGGAAQSASASASVAIGGGGGGFGGGGGGASTAYNGTATSGKGGNEGNNGTNGAGAGGFGALRWLNIAEWNQQITNEAGKAGSVGSIGGNAGFIMLLYITPNEVCSLSETPVAGACGTAHGVGVAAAPTTNLCSAGTETAVTINATNYTWSCAGQHGGAAASCSAERLLPGACGTAHDIAAASPPAANLCTTGTASAVTTNAANYTWSCYGAGGDESLCSAPRKINGVCGTAHGVAAVLPPAANLCTTGTTSAVTTSAAAYTWKCAGANGGDESSCSAPRKINGACGSDNGKVLSSAPVNLCSAGTAGGVSGSGPWTWECTGVNEGSNASCSTVVCLNDTLPTMSQALTNPMNLVEGYCHTANLGCSYSAVCAAAQGNGWSGRFYVGSTTDGTPGGGTYCFCRTKSYGTNQCGTLSSWVLQANSSASYCATNCAGVCATNIGSWGAGVRW